MVIQYPLFMRLLELLERQPNLQNTLKEKARVEVDSQELAKILEAALQKTSDLQLKDECTS